MNDKQYLAFKQICRYNKYTLSRSLYELLKAKYKKVIYNEKFIYAVGDIPVALCAHMDTVFTNTPVDIYYDKEANVLWSPQGLGADDRAGVWAILSILKTQLRPSVIFTMDEECGGLGASALIKKYKKPLTDLKYVIQLDRQGMDDCVFYDCDNRDFVEYVESFGFHEQIGSFTDISIICPEWKVAGVNLSVGYFREHSPTETLNVSYLLSTITKTIKMLKQIGKAEHFKYIPFDYTGYGRYGGYGYGTIDHYLKCHQCGKVFSEYEMFAVKGADGKPYFYCCDCISDDDKIKWCKYCKDPYEYNELMAEDVCPDCEKKN